MAAVVDRCLHRRNRSGMRYWSLSPLVSPRVSEQKLVAAYHGQIIIPETASPKIVSGKNNKI